MANPTLDINYNVCKVWSPIFSVFNIMSPLLKRKSILPISSEFSQFEGQGTSWNEISCTRARIVSAQCGSNIKYSLFLYPPKMPINSIFKVSHGKARQTRKEDFQTFHNHVCGPSSRKAFLKGICFITEVSNHRDFTFVWFYKEMILNTNLIEAQAKSEKI